MIKLPRIFSVLALALTATQAFSFHVSDLKQGHFVLQAGGYQSMQGESQNIGIQGLVGNHYSVTMRHDTNGLFGLGYFVDGQDKGWYNMAYGIDAFYLFKTSVAGNVVQEQLFTNLSYHYDVSHLPVYADVKAIFKDVIGKYSLTLDAGIGPNFMTTAHYQEKSLDGITLPDRAFSGQTKTTFSATAGIGLKVNSILGSEPMECGYRFFYLGRNELGKNSSQILSNLSTGNNYANALVCSLTV